jgi:hypothetical protein
MNHKITTTRPLYRENEEPTVGSIWQYYDPEIEKRDFYMVVRFQKQIGLICLSNGRLFCRPTIINGGDVFDGAKSFFTKCLDGETIYIEIHN